VSVRLMTMEGISTLVLGQCWRMVMARGCIYRESVVPCRRGCGLCNISIPLFGPF
jgi:hypothetical protein